MVASTPFFFLVCATSASAAFLKAYNLDATSNLTRPLGFSPPSPKTGPASFVAPPPPSVAPRGFRRARCGG